MGRSHLLSEKAPASWFRGPNANSATDDKPEEGVDDVDGGYGFLRLLDRLPDLSNVDERFRE
jgi:hypothetical protein